MDARTAFKVTIGRLRDAGVSSFTLTAELLLLHVAGRDRTWLYAHPEEELTHEREKRLFALVERRIAGEPTQYLTGKQEFWGMEFEVTPAVLIPRPETEHVIEVALDRLALREIRASRKQTLRGDGLYIADVGTGSGCIAVALAKELPGAWILATDVSPAALEIARRSASRLGYAERIDFRECNLLDGCWAGPATGAVPLPEVSAFDLIVSNPPYIGQREAPTLAREVREHEPHVALFGGEEGYEFYGELITQAADHLKSGGLLVLELGHKSLPAVQPLFDATSWTRVGVTNDLAGIARVIAAERA
jgi:release factor glutamine methyltransferase